MSTPLHEDYYRCLSCQTVHPREPNIPGPNHLCPACDPEEDR